MNTRTKNKVFAGVFFAVSLLVSGPITAFSSQTLDSLRAAGTSADLVFDGASRRGEDPSQVLTMESSAPSVGAPSQVQKTSKPFPWKKVGEVAKKALPYVGAAALGLFIGVFLSGGLLPGIILAIGAVLMVAAGGGEIFIGF